MPNVAMFFDQLSRSGHEYLPAKTSGTLRFDLSQGDQLEHWLVAVKKGNVFVSRDDRDADVVVSADAGLFASLVTGETNVIAAILRNELSVKGSLPLLLAFRRALPSSPGAVDPRRTTPGTGARP